ncbi:chromate efflux transporter [Polymorphobacter megasporae]|uniref:chromate efflux transporter n=1 Tax=Glacieibacterium megasporae TaxID=2835787 RepID=UPI001C1E011B|nr:chromate efflux transporter [Polymorphobacter megasporae]UAJ09801.1 chromate efflux transporter [Polymorphobacter megasporae]
MIEVFIAFLRLGLTSFGGPVAHLGYFRRAFVGRWLDEARFAEIVGLCSFLPGPTSSQVGVAIGLDRAGVKGAFAAWLGFTLPSAILMIAFAFVAGSLHGPVAAAAIHGLKLAAVAIVAQAVVGMARSLTPDLKRLGIAVVAVAIVAVAGRFGQLAAIAAGALLGLILTRESEAHSLDVTAPRRFPVSRRTGGVCLAVFAILLAGLPLLRAATGDLGVAVADSFYRSGALVFGGGHVVLPLLRAEVVPPGWIGGDAFLSGYGAAQALPGPLFAFAAYLGAVIGGAGVAVLALVALFAPGMLLLFGALPFWSALSAQPLARAALRGTNAAVVGILASALYDPVGTGAIGSWRDAVIAVAGFAALTFAKAPPLAVVAATVGAAVIFG